MGAYDLCDMYIAIYSAHGPAALWLRAYISGESLPPILQILHITKS